MGGVCVNTQPSTPETDAVERHEGNWDTKALRMTNHARKLEIERDELRAALSGRTVSCEQCNTLAAESQAMREVIRDAYAYIDDLNDKEYEGQSKLARCLLAKLKPFIK
jgi:hypothetical protein